MRVKHRDLLRAWARIEDDTYHAGLRLSFAKTQTVRFADRINSDLDDAPRGISYEPKPRSSDVSDPTGQKASTGRPDPAAQVAAAVYAKVGEAAMLAKQLRQVCGGIEDLMRGALPLPDDVASQLAGADQVHVEGHRKAYVCANLHCQATVSNTPGDRLRGGRCDPCRKYLSRNGEERPRHLCALSSGDTEQIVSVDGLGLDHDRIIVTP